jgi:hypothetical protein
VLAMVDHLDDVHHEERHPSAEEVATIIISRPNHSDGHGHG